MEGHQHRCNDHPSIQAKTGKPVAITLHPIAQGILDKQAAKLQEGQQTGKYVFALTTANGANKVLEIWMKDAGIEKYITWSCARLSISILLQEQSVNDATVAHLTGHATTEQLCRTYMRHLPKNQAAAISLIVFSPKGSPFGYTKEKQER